jgi:Uma2 family endonuclease
MTLLVEEYLKLEQSSGERHEYHRGHVRAMAGAQPEHTYITADTAAAIRAQVSGRICRVGAIDLRVKIEATMLYTYPDVVVVCGEPQYETIQGIRTLLNPTLLAEVLSETTEREDRGRKFLHYRQIASLSDYLLIAQDAPRVEHFTRDADDRWVWTIYEGLEAAIPLPALHCILRLADIYQAIEFPQESVE